jgi:hypothetical protein
MRNIFAAALGFGLILAPVVVMQFGDPQMGSDQEVRRQQQAMEIASSSVILAQGHMTISQEQAPQDYFTTFPQLLCHSHCPD